MNYEMPTYIQKGMIADHPNTPLILKNQLYNEINFETNLEFRKIVITKMILSENTDDRTAQFLWLDLKELMNDLKQVDIIQTAFNTQRR